MGYISVGNKIDPNDWKDNPRHSAEQIAIDRAELEKWLADSGWEKTAATSIADRFFGDSEWLAKRLAVSAS